MRVLPYKRALMRFCGENNDVGIGHVTKMRAGTVNPTDRATMRAHPVQYTLSVDTDERFLRTRGRGDAPLSPYFNSSFAEKTRLYRTFLRLTASSTRLVTLR